MNNLEISFKSLLILSSILEKFSKSINSKILEIIFIKFSLNISSCIIKYAMLYLA